MEAEALNIEIPPIKFSSSIARKANINDSPITKLKETQKFKKSETLECIA
jgi:hypothetical protein